MKETYVHLDRNGLSVELILTGRTATPVITGSGMTLVEVVEVAKIGVTGETIPVNPYTFWVLRKELYKVEDPS